MIIAYIGDENHEPRPEMMKKMYEQLNSTFDREVVTLPYYVNLENMNETSIIHYTELRKSDIDG